MKHIVFTFLFFAGAFAAAPDYDLESSSVLGAYEFSNGTDEYLDGNEVEVKFNQQGKLTVYVGPYDFEVEKNSKGDLVFGATVDDECDDPGCWYFLEIDGVIKAKKVGKKYIPAIQFSVLVTYDYPVEDDDLSGDVTSTEEFLWDRTIVDEKPVYFDVEVDQRLKNIQDSCYQARAKDKNGPDFLCLTNLGRLRFRKDVDMSLDSKAIAIAFPNASEWSEISTAEVRSLIIENAKYHLSVYKILSKRVIESSANSTEKQKQVAAATSLYESFIQNLDAYLTTYKGTKVYIDSRHFSGLSHFDINRPVIYLVNEKFRSITKLGFNNQ
jgi:hypothetical protein